jgi:hypothetical protein
MCGAMSLPRYPSFHRRRRHRRGLLLRPTLYALFVWTVYYCGAGLRSLAPFPHVPHPWESFDGATRSGERRASRPETIPCTPPIPADCDLGNTTGSGVPVLLVRVEPIGSRRSWATRATAAAERRLDADATANRTTTLRPPPDPKEHGQCRLQQRLCEHQQWRRIQTSYSTTSGDAPSLETTSGINSITWTLDTEYVGTRQSREAWEWLNATHSPLVKVVYLDQNPLAVVLSFLHEEHLASACTGVVVCPEEEVSDFTIPLALVMELLDQVTRGQESLRRLLDQLAVPYVRIPYDRRSVEEDGIAYVRLLRFLDDASPGATTDWTPEQLSHWMGFRSHSRTRAATGLTVLRKATDYAEAVAALKGSRFGHALEQMLDPSSSMDTEQL